MQRESATSQIHRIYYYHVSDGKVKIAVVQLKAWIQVGNWTPGPVLNLELLQLFAVIKGLLCK